MCGARLLWIGLEGWVIGHELVFYRIVFSAYTVHILRSTTLAKLREHEVCASVKLREADGSGVDGPSPHTSFVHSHTYQTKAEEQGAS